MIIEPGKQDTKLKEYLDSGEYKKVLLVYFHGVGDAIMFQVLFDRLKELYPEIHFDIGLAKGLGEELIYPDAILLENLDNIEEGYDLTALIHFPVEIDGMTKSELCCRDELGIDLLWGHNQIGYFDSPLIAVHFNQTAIPSVANPDPEIAEKIWNEIVEAGFIPIETHFSHVFDNPVNVKFDFVDRHVRNCKPTLKSLVGLLQSCRGVIAVPSGPFHCALASINPDNILYLEKDIPLRRFTYLPVKTVNVKNYKDGSVTNFLKTL